MDVFSLEEEEGNDLFITQEVKQNDGIEDMSGINAEEGDVEDMEWRDLFGVDISQNSNLPHYSDISDDDFELNSELMTRAKK